MGILRENNKILILENGKKILEMCYIGDEFIIILYKEEPIEITKELDESLYSNFKKILENKYEFNDEYSSQTKGEIIWLSDLYCEMPNQKNVKDINRIVLSDLDDSVIVSAFNPYFKERNIKKGYNLIAFSPKGHGRYSKNLDTGLTFQDDIVIAFDKTLKNEIEDINNKSRIRK